MVETGRNARSERPCVWAFGFLAPTRTRRSTFLRLRMWRVSNEVYFGQQPTPPCDTLHLFGYSDWCCSYSTGLNPPCRTRDQQVSSRFVIPVVISPSRIWHFRYAHLIFSTWSLPILTPSIRPQFYSSCVLNSRTPGPISSWMGLNSNGYCDRCPPITNPVTCTI